MRQFLLNDQARDDALLFGECSEYSREECDKANGFCKLPTKEFQNCIESMCTTLVACRRTIQKQLRWLIPRKREADSSEEVAKSLNRASPLCRGKHAASCMLKQVLDQAKLYKDWATVVVKPMVAREALEDYHKKSMLVFNLTQKLNSKYSKPDLITARSLTKVFEPFLNFLVQNAQRFEKKKSKVLKKENKQPGWFIRLARKSLIRIAKSKAKKVKDFLDQFRSRKRSSLVVKNKISKEAIEFRGDVREIQRNGFQYQFEACKHEDWFMKGGKPEEVPIELPSGPLIMRIRIPTQSSLLCEEQTRKIEKNFNSTESKEWLGILGTGIPKNTKWKRMFQSPQLVGKYFLWNINSKESLKSAIRSLINCETDKKCQKSQRLQRRTAVVRELTAKLPLDFLMHLACEKGGKCVKGRMKDNGQELIRIYAIYSMAKERLFHTLDREMRFLYDVISRWSVCRENQNCRNVVLEMVKVRSIFLRFGDPELSGIRSVKQFTSFGFVQDAKGTVFESTGTTPLQRMFIPLPKDIRDLVEDIDYRRRNRANETVMATLRNYIFNDTQLTADEDGVSFQTVDDLTHRIANRNVLVDVRKMEEQLDLCLRSWGVSNCTQEAQSKYQEALQNYFGALSCRKLEEQVWMLFDQLDSCWINCHRTKHQLQIAVSVLVKWYTDAVAKGFQMKAACTTPWCEKVLEELVGMDVAEKIATIQMAQQVPTSMVPRLQFYASRSVVLQDSPTLLELDRWLSLTGIIVTSTTILATLVAFVFGLKSRAFVVNIYPALVMLGVALLNSFSLTFYALSFSTGTQILSVYENYWRFFLIPEFVAFPLYSVVLLVFLFQYLDATFLDFVEQVQMQRRVRILTAVVFLATIGAAVGAGIAGVYFSAQEDPVARQQLEFRVIFASCTLFLALVLLVYAAFVYLIFRSKLKKIEHSTPMWQGQAMMTVMIAAAAACVIALSLVLSFTILRLPSQTIRPPVWANVMFGKVIPELLISGALLFVLTSGIYVGKELTDEVRGQSATIPLLRRTQRNLEPLSKPVPKQYDI